MIDIDPGALLALLSDLTARLAHAEASVEALNRRVVELQGAQAPPPPPPTEPGSDGT